MPRTSKKNITTDAKDVLEDGGTPNAPATDEPDADQEQTTEEHDNSAKSIEQVEIEALRAQLAEAQAQLEKKSEPTSHRPVPEEELTPEQREIRMLKDQLARQNAKKVDAAEEFFENSDDGILVHFVADGLTSNGRTFYRGQEVTFGPQAYAATLDRHGNSWLKMSDEEQMDRFGEIKFRLGPWPGKREYEEEALKNVSISDKAPILHI